MPSSERRTSHDIAVAVLSQAAAYQATARGDFLRALAAVIAKQTVRHGQAEGRYRMVRSPNGVAVQCENAAQVGWVEALCHAVKINFIVPKNRALERELHIRL